MSTPIITAIVATCIAGLIWIKFRQRKIDKQGWNELPGINNIILTATSKEQLTEAIETLSKIRKASFSNEYLFGACGVLINLIEAKIKIDYPLSSL